jgi:tetratricopeptide (TPR) repeat protein
VAELDEVLAQAQALLGPQAYMAGFVSADLARFRLELGEPARAVAHARLALAVVSRESQDDSANVAMARLGLGRALLDTQQAAEAQTLLEAAHAGLARQRGPTSPLALEAAALRAMALLQQGRAADAWAGLQPDLAAMRSSSPATRFRGLRAAGLSRGRLGDPEGARTLLQEALAGLPDTPVNAPRRQRAKDDLARLGPQAQPVPPARPAGPSSPG